MPAFGHYEVNVDAVSYSAAQVILPLVYDPPPASVVDVGCGCGAWLKAAAELGTVRCVGLDGPHGYAPEFHQVDLADHVPVVDRFDLALCLEVAEHLPPSAAAPLVQALVDMSDRVLFSAATPGQGGDGHINEQPHDYWIRLFAEHGYDCDDIRARIPGVAAWWYRDNIRLFTRHKEGL